jgi:hypothetical protein
MFSKGFYWVKVEGGISSDGISCEPAYYTGEPNGWGLCGQDPVMDEADFIKIIPLVVPTSLHEQELDG